MAPINPNEIILAVEPIISKDGGLLSTKEVSMLSEILKKYSKNLVSKCVYCNILLATKEEVLDVFLKDYGWKMMNDWLKDAIKKDNHAFLIEVIKVLNKCPINLERLKENDTPKLLKKLVKVENTELASSAKRLRLKWKEFVNQNSSQDNEMSKDKTQSTDKPVKEKRKLKDASNRNEQADNQNKKLKTKDENVNLNENGKSSPPSSQQQESSAIDKNALNTLNTNDLVKSEDKPITAKVKLGKMRSIGVLEKNNENGYTKPLPTAKSSSKHSNVGGSFMTKSAQLLKQTASTPSTPLNKLRKSDFKPGTAGVKIIDAPSLSFSEWANQTSSQHTAKHIIKESAGFMDELNAVSLTPKIKKKRKKEEKVERSDKKRRDSESDDQNEPSKIEIDNLDFNLTPTDSNKQFNEINSIESPKKVENEYLEFRTPIPFDREKKPTKSILQSPFTKGPKETKRTKLTWADDDKLEKVTFFELDDQERCNVSRDSFKNNLKKDMTDERQLLNTKFRCIPTTLVKDYKLTKIDLTGAELFQIEIKSEERDIQRERLSRVLEDLNLFGPKPEFPKEPDNPEDRDEGLSANSAKSVINIPLDEENNILTDYSNEVYKICGLENDNLSNFQTNNNMQSLGSNSQSQYSQNFQQQQFNFQQQTQQQPQQQIYNSTAYSSMFNTQPILQQQQQQPPQQQNQQMNTQNDSRWTNSNWTSSNSNQNNYQSNNNGRNNYQNNSRVNKGANKGHYGFGSGLRPCKFFSKNGKCKKGDSCPFKH